MKLKIKQGTTSKLVRVFAQDSAATDGSGKTGIAYNAAGLTAYYLPEGDAAATAITLYSGTVGTYSTGCWSEVDSTNMPGIYEIGLPDAAIDATSEGSVIVMLKGAADMAPILIEIELDAIDYRNGSSAGLSNLDAAISTRSTFDQSTQTVTTDSASRTASQADVSALATASSIAALNDFDPATQTVTTDAASRTASQADVSALATSASIAALNNLSAVQVENAVWDASISSHNSAGSTGKALKQLKEGVISQDGSVDDASATATSFVSNLTEAVDGFFHDKVIVFVSGSLSGQARHIETYNGTTKAITVSQAFTSAPSDADEFLILATHEHSLGEIADGVWDEARSGHTTVGTFGYFLDAQVSAAGGGSAPTAQEIVDAWGNQDQSVYSTAGTLGYFLDAQVSGAGAGGSGLYQVTVRVEDSGNNALQGARVNVDGTTLTLATGSSGEVTFNLDSGVYLLNVSPPAGYTTPIGQVVTVTTSDISETFTLVGSGTCSPGWVG